MSWAARGPPRRSGEDLPVGAVERLVRRSRQRQVVLSRGGCIVGCEGNTRHIWRQASRTGVASVAVEVGGRSPDRLVGRLELRCVGCMVVHVMPEVGGVGRGLVLAVGRRHSPRGLQREQAHQNESNEAAHQSSILGTVRAGTGLGAIRHRAGVDKSRTASCGSGATEPAVAPRIRATFRFIQRRTTLRNSQRFIPDRLTPCCA
jgi:hypothetical protein